jgi:hypothetical protein
VTLPDGQTIQTSYTQLALMIYRSGKRVRTNFDSRGRMIGEDKVDTASNMPTSYVSGMSYNVSGQMTLGSDSRRASR